ISQLRTGHRKLPSNPRAVHDIAAFFAGRCKDDYLRSALRQFTEDPRLNLYVDEAVLTDIIFDWFTGADKKEDSPASRFVSSFELFSPDSFPGNKTFSQGSIPEPNGVFAYYSNEGKRQALRDMITYINSLHEPCNVLLFTDEAYDWLIEDQAFSQWLNAALGQLAAAGVTCERIQPPFNDIEFTFSAIERWLPIYMAGAIEQYYYPWARDQLHRRTIFVVPGHIAMYSNSFYGEHEAPLTALTRNADIVNVCGNEFAGIKQRCRPAISTFLADSDRIFTEAEAIAAIKDVGVYKTNSLSVNTLPHEINERIRRYGTAFTFRMCESFERRGRARAQVLREHIITDIMCLPKLADVLAGRVPVPGTQAIPQGALYYTPQEYKAHLERILWHLDMYPNYQAVLTDAPHNDNIIMYAKGNSHAMLVKRSSPFAVFSVAEPTMATAFCNYLRRIADEKLTVGARSATIHRLREELKLLTAAM
ncbi:MAG: hypothetical protein Q4B48_03895, partial [Syntrophomonadaceae bacterium]|nr:hypothetical protein [Syntrophomonadaceae bacterium]